MSSEMEVCVAVINTRNTIIDLESYVLNQQNLIHFVMKIIWKFVVTIMTMHGR